MSHTAIALLSASLALQAVAEVQLLPAGEFEGRDGRPGKGLKWKLTDAQGRKLAAWLNQRHGGNVAFNLDYEHQALLSEKNGQPAPASGWATRFEWRDGAGLWSLNTEWTERAAQMIKAKEYRYISPALVFDTRTGEVIGLINASLTNIPNLDDLSPVAQERITALNAFSTTNLEPSMNEVLKALLKALGLPDAATEQEATTAIATLKAQAEKAATLTTEVATLKAKATTAEPDPTKYVSLDKFNEVATEVATLRAAGVDREVDQLIDQAKADGKLVPAAEDVWRTVGKTDIAKLRALVTATPANPALAGKLQTGDKKTEQTTTGEPTEAELAICKSMGMTVEQYRKGAAETAAA